MKKMGSIHTKRNKRAGNRSNSNEKDKIPCVFDEKHARVGNGGPNHEQLMLASFGFAREYIHRTANRNWRYEDIAAIICDYVMDSNPDFTLFFSKISDNCQICELKNHGTIALFNCNYDITNMSSLKSSTFFALSNNKCNHQCQCNCGVYNLEIGVLGIPSTLLQCYLPLICDIIKTVDTNEFALFIEKMKSNGLNEIQIHGFGASHSLIDSEKDIWNCMGFSYMCGNNTRHIKRLIYRCPGYNYVESKFHTKYESEYCWDNGKPYCDNDNFFKTIIEMRYDNETNQLSFWKNKKSLIGKSINNGRIGKRKQYFNKGVFYLDENLTYFPIICCLGCSCHDRSVGIGFKAI